VIYLIGGAGYIGSRLALELRQRGQPFRILDACILGNECEHWRELTKVDVFKSGALDCIEPEDTVVWLASLHNGDWKGIESVGERLMWRMPYNLLHRRCRLLYVSSMQVFALSRCPYADAKARAEHMLAARAQAERRSLCIIRPGTVWGWLRAGLPNRVHTVPNRYLLTGELPDGFYSSYICSMGSLVDTIAAALVAPDSQFKQVLNVVDPPTPVNRLQLADAVGPKFFPEEVEGIGLDGEHPMEIYRKYYLGQASEA
jgi:nucleoside-diphosphate-sugar epimerase